MNLHVTLVTGVLNPSYFNVSNAQDIPDAILTMSNFNEFYSIGVQAFLDDGITSITKLFSNEQISESILNQIYTRVDRVDRFKWESYPILDPKLFHERDKLSFVLHKGNDMLDGIYHVNAFESAISTMESETVAAMNVVQLLKKKWTLEY